MHLHSGRLPMSRDPKADAELGWHQRRCTRLLAVDHVQSGATTAGAVPLLVHLHSSGGVRSAAADTLRALGFDSQGHAVGLIIGATAATHRICRPLAESPLLRPDRTVYRCSCRPRQPSSCRPQQQRQWWTVLCGDAAPADPHAAWHSSAAAQSSAVRS
jgi:hypothetical protein